MRKRGWLACGIEPGIATAPPLRAGGLVYDSFEKISPPPGGFEIITFWHSLEHIHDLDSTLASTVRALSPAGRVLIAVPNFRSADAAQYGARWAAYDVPRHLYHFSVEGIARLAARHRLRLLSATPCRRDVFYVAALSEARHNPAPRCAGLGVRTSSAWHKQSYDRSRLVPLLYTLDRDVA
jgi:hypothetical protein